MAINLLSYARSTVYYKPQKDEAYLLSLKITCELMRKHAGLRSLALVNASEARASCRPCRRSSSVRAAFSCAVWDSGPVWGWGFRKGFGFRVRGLGIGCYGCVRKWEVSFKSELSREAAGTDTLM